MKITSRFPYFDVFETHVLPSASEEPLSQMSHYLTISHIPSNPMSQNNLELPQQVALPVATLTITYPDYLW